MDKTEITLPPSSLTLSRSGLKRLCEIVSKAAEGDPDANSVFVLSTKQASVSAHSVEDLMNTKWPKDIETVRLVATSHKNNKWVAVHFDNSRPNHNRITVSGFDSDWVASTAGEIADLSARFIVDRIASTKGGKRSCGCLVIDFFRDGFVNIRSDFLWVATSFAVRTLYRKNISVCLHR